MPEHVILVISPLLLETPLMENIIYGVTINLIFVAVVPVRNIRKVVIKNQLKSTISTSNR